mgnify:CR=1 FL=1
MVDRWVLVFASLGLVIGGMALSVLYRTVVGETISLVMAVTGGFIYYRLARPGKTRG